ncbi:MAG: biotin/lipoyl-containing protein, partial [Actinomycetota bacterium]
MSLGLTTIVRMPRFDEHDYRGQVVELCVRSGDLVEAGHLLCRVESTRTDLEIEAPRSGRVQWSVSPGETVGVGAPLCELVHPLDDDDPAGPSPSQPRRSSAPSAPVSPTSGVPAVRTGISWTGSMRPPASPAVVVGSERHGAVVIDALLELGIRPVGVLDDAHEPGEVVHQGIEVLPHGLDYERWVREGTGAAYLGFGLGDDNRPRRDVFRGLAAAGFVLPPIVHPRASVARG